MRASRRYFGWLKSCNDFAKSLSRPRANTRPPQAGILLGLWACFGIFQCIRAFVLDGIYLRDKKYVQLHVLVTLKSGMN